MLSLLIMLLHFFISSAFAEPLEYNGTSYRFMMGGDFHLDYDYYSGQDTTQLFFTAAEYFQVNGIIGMGDMFGARKSDLDGNRTWDCYVDRRWDTSCEYPSGWLGQRYRNYITTWDPLESKVDLWIRGNHDDHPPIEAIPSLDTIDEWFKKWFNPNGQPCVVGGPDAGLEYVRCDIHFVENDLVIGTWTILLIHDQTSHLDRSVGGRCDYKDYRGLEEFRRGCSTKGWPVGTITRDQLLWLESEVSLAVREGRYVGVVTHQPPANTVAFSGREAGYQPVCNNIYVQSPPPNSHFPLDSDFLPNRTDLSTPIPNDPYGRTPIEAAEQYVGAQVSWWPGESPDDQWALDLIHRLPVGAIKWWASAHNHVPVPDVVDADGRGMVWQDPISGTTFLAHGAVTRYWITTYGAAGYGHPQAAYMDLHADGSWDWTRVSIQSHATGLSGHGCGTAAQLPATRPAPWVNVPVIHGTSGN